MVALAVDIKNFVIFFHEWFVKPSRQVKRDIKKVDGGFVCHNFQREAMVLEDFCNFLFGLLNLSFSL